MDNYFELLKGTDKVYVQVDNLTYPSMAKAIEAKDGTMWVKATIISVWHPVFSESIDVRISNNKGKIPIHKDKIKTIEEFEKENDIQKKKRKKK